MGWFKKEIKVAMAPLIQNQVQRAFTDNRDNLLKLLSATKLEPNQLEVAIYAAYQELLAMTLAGLDERVRLGYVEAAWAIMEELDAGDGELLERRFSEYSFAYGHDVADGKAHLAPGMIGLALENMFGATDESVVFARMALIMTHKACVEAKVPFFKDLKVVV